MRTTWTFHSAGQLVFGRNAARQLGEGSMQSLARKWCVPRRRFTPDRKRHAQYAELLTTSG